jgi:hypothetical protein
MTETADPDTETLFAGSAASGFRPARLLIAAVHLSLRVMCSACLCSGADPKASFRPGVDFVQGAQVSYSAASSRAGPLSAPEVGYLIRSLYRELAAHIERNGKFSPTRVLAAHETLAGAGVESGQGERPASEPWGRFMSSTQLADPHGETREIAP